MTVLIAYSITPAIRGILKRWFVEPTANVFVGTVNRRTRDKVLAYIKRNSKDLSLLIITTEATCQGFRIERWGSPDRRDTEISGLSLIAERWADAESLKL